MALPYSSFKRNGLFAKWKKADKISKNYLLAMAGGHTTQHAE